MRLGCGAIDFVGEDHLMENRSGVKAEGMGFAIEDG
jgi:hypothetical protein